MSKENINEALKRGIRIGDILEDFLDVYLEAAKDIFTPKGLIFALGKNNSSHVAFDKYDKIYEIRSSGSFYPSENDPFHVLGYLNLRSYGENFSRERKRKIYHKGFAGIYSIAAPSFFDYVVKEGDHIIFLIEITSQEEVLICIDTVHTYLFSETKKIISSLLLNF